MDIYGYLAKNILYPLTVMKNGSEELNYLKEFEKSQYLSSDAIKEMQLRKLKLLITRAYENCSYYTMVMNELGLVPEDIKSLDDVANFPSLSKENIQDNLDAMMAKDVLPDGFIKDMTGGSTGKPLIFYYDKARLASRQAATIRHYRWSGWDIGEKTAIVWAAVRDLRHGRQGSWKRSLRNKFLNRQLVLDASSIREDNFREFTSQIRNFRPSIYRGYAKSMVLFAQYVMANNISDLNPKAIITSAEVLDDEERLLIESAFHCKVFNLYGCREVAVIASECKMHEGLHVNAENLLVEVVNEKGPAHQGETGEILITDLENLAMPLIRYKIGDVGSLSAKACSCGRGLPVVERLEGRVTDFLETVDGVKISGVAISTYVITNIKGIQQVQVIQEHLDSVIINIVRNQYFEPGTEKLLIEKFRNFIGTTNMSVAANYVDDIPKTASGKYRFLISTIHSDK